MQKIEINASFWELFPEGQINVMELNGVNNHPNKDNESKFQEMLVDAGIAAQKFITEPVFSENEIVSQWRKAFQQFKTKKGARSSIEALLKRVSQGHEFSPINPLVDFYNAMSLTYGVPVGGEDTDKIDGTMQLGLASGGESFRPLGAEEDSPALPGEMIYYDKTGAICRCLNWREAQRTMLTEETTNLIFVMESVNLEQAKRANLAMQELKRLVEKYFKVTGSLELFQK